MVIPNYLHAHTPAKRLSPDNKFIIVAPSKDIWLLFIMAPYIFLNRDDNHFIPLFETTKMVANAEENIVDNWSV